MRNEDLSLSHGWDSAPSTAGWLPVILITNSTAGSVLKPALGPKVPFSSDTPDWDLVANSIHTMETAYTWPMCFSRRAVRGSPPL